MESKSMSFKDGGKNVQITINHYHNEIKSNPINDFAGAWMGSMLMMREFMAPLLGFSGNIENVPETKPENLIENKNDISEDVKYEIVDDVENNEFLYFSIESVKNVVENEQEVHFNYQKIKELEVNFEKDVKFDILTNSTIHRNLYKEIQRRLGTMMIRSDVFFVNSFYDKENNKIAKSATVFYDTDICERVVNRYSKQGDYVIVTDIVARKVKLPFAGFINRVDYVCELNSCFRIEKLPKNKFKISRII